MHRRNQKTERKNVTKHSFPSSDGFWWMIPRDGSDESVFMVSSDTKGRPIKAQNFSGELFDIADVDGDWMKVLSPEDQKIPLRREVDSKNSSDKTDNSHSAAKLHLNSTRQRQPHISVMSSSNKKVEQEQHLQSRGNCV
jgi:hypothetical protein